MKRLYKRFVLHVKCWNSWRKVNRNGWFYKFMVLIGAMVSPTFEIFFKVDEE